MFKSFLRSASVLILALIVTSASALTAQAQGDAGKEDNSAREEVVLVEQSIGRRAETDPVQILRAARTIYIRPNDYIDADYLEYRLSKHAEFQQWKIAFVKDGGKADLILEVHRRALNYIFTIVDPESSLVVVKGKVVAINDLVAAEDISFEIVKKMSAVRALPADER